MSDNPDSPVDSGHPVDAGRQPVDAGQPADTRRPVASGQQPVDSELSVDRVFPTWSDPVATAASTAVGGPWGRHARVGRNRFWTPLRVILAMAIVVLAFAWIKQEPCAGGDWSGSKQYTHFCYSDAVPLFGIHGLDSGAVPYFDSAVEYPVLTGWFMYGAARLSAIYDSAALDNGLLPDMPAVYSYYAVTALLLSLCALAMAWAVQRLSGRRPWDAAMVALSPLLFVHAFTNWDLWAIAWSSAGLVAWSRRRPVLAGVLLGFGIAAKLYPLLFLGVLFILCLRVGRLREWGLATVAAGLSWAAINVPVALGAADNWSLFFRLNQTRTADPDSLWRILEHFTGSTGTSLFDPPLGADQAPTGLNIAVALGTAAVCAGVAFVGLRAPVRPRLPQLLFLLVAGFLLVNKVWSPQFSLWLLPLAVLARPEWRLLLAWQAAEAFLWGPRLLWYLGVDNSGLRIEWFFLAVGIRDVLVIALMLYVLRDLWDPRWDVVRRSGMDDPAGGVLDGAVDRFTLFRHSRDNGADDAGKRAVIAKTAEQSEAAQPLTRRGRLPDRSLPLADSRTFAPRSSTALRSRRARPARRCRPRPGPQ